MNSPRLSKAIVASALIYLTAQALGADVSTLRGSVSLDRNGMPQITECNTNRVIPLGSMAYTDYADFARFYSKISGDGRVATVVDISGELSQTGRSNGDLILTSPAISAYRWGTCATAPRKPDDATALSKLLKELKIKLDRFRAIPKGQVPYELDPPIDDLIGATGNNIYAALGSPDVCDSEDTIHDDEDATLENCEKSDEWAYFFCAREPLMFGGCFGMELAFNKNGTVMFARWQGYR